MSSERQDIIQTGKDRAWQYLDMAGVIFLALNVDQTVESVNRRGCEVFGYEKSDIIGLNWFDTFLPEKVRGDSKAAFEQLIAEKGGAMKYYESAILTKAGQECVIGWHNSVLCDDGGEVLAVLSCGRDVTEDKKVERELENIARFSHDNPNPVLRIAKDGLLLYANPASDMLLTDWGCSVGEFVPDSWRWKVSGVIGAGLSKTVHAECGGRSFMFFVVPIFGAGYANIYVHDVTESNKLEAALQKARDELEVGVRERTAELNKTVEVLQGEIIQRMRIEKILRESKEKYRELVENANSIIMRRTVEGKITFFNEFGQKFFGYTEEEILGRNIVGAIVPGIDESGVDLEAVIQAISSNPERYQNHENENMRSNGEKVWVSWTNKAITDEDGRVVELLCIGNDITERKNAEKERDRLNKMLKHQTVRLREMNRRLSQAEQLERRRLAKILHDHLQQLLVGAKLHIGSLNRSFNNTHLHEGLTQINELLDQSINMSRSLTVELSPPILHDGGLVPAFWWIVRHMKNKYGLKVEMSIDDEFDFDTIEEESRILLFEALRELLFNVVKHAETSDAQVFVSYSNDKEIKIEIKDKGVGFSAANIHDEQNTQEHFGLFNLCERLELIGGRFDVKSSPGEGTQVVLSVPVSGTEISREQTSGAVSELPQKHSEMPAGAVASGEASEKTRVLLVDDHKIVREGLNRLLLQENDIEVIGQAQNGQMAVELVSRHQPDVVIMDITMPVMDGIEATRRIRLKFPAMKVIGLSVHDKADMAEAMLRAGAVGYLTKMDASEKLVSAIRSC